DRAFSGSPIFMLQFFFQEKWSLVNLRRALRARVSIATATLAFLIAVVGAIVGLEAAHVLDERAKAIEDGKRDTANLVKSLIQHAELTFRTADAVLLGIVEQSEHDGLETKAGRERLTSWFQQAVSQTSLFQGFAVVDDRGFFIVGAREQWSAVDNSGQEYFRFHRDNNDRKLHIGAPLGGRNSGEWLIPVSRRISTSDGGFAGVVVAMIRTEYFQKLYDKLDIGHGGAILLASGEGKLLVRRPFEDENVGRNMLQGGIFRQLQGLRVGTAEIKSLTDGIVRLNSYEQGETYSLVVAVAKETDEVLAPWRKEVSHDVLKITLTLLMIALLGLFLQRMASRKTKLNQLLEIALSSMPNGLCMFDREKRIAISNARYREMYGLTEEEVRPGTPLRQILETHLRNGETSELGIDGYIDACLNLPTQTQLLQDGRTAFIRRNRIAEGGWIATHEDITELKRNQDLLVAKTAELEQMNARFDAAINNMLHGVCLYDADQRIVVSNRRYAEIYHLSPAQIRPGTSLREVLEYRRQRGTHFKAMPNDHIGADVKQSREIQELADGRIVSIARHKMPGGGWLTSHEDITDRARAERKIAYLA